MGEASVIIAISSEHRRESLEAVQFAIDALKASVPIWKKVSNGLGCFVYVGAVVAVPSGTAGRFTIQSQIFTSYYILAI